jgi:hypothetical protein
MTDEEIHDCFQQRSKDKVQERRLIANAIEEKLRGAIAYELTKRMIIDMPMARAAIDAVLNKEKNGD